MIGLSLVKPSAGAEQHEQGERRDGVDHVRHRQQHRVRRRSAHRQVGERERRRSVPSADGDHRVADVLQRVVPDDVPVAGELRTAPERRSAITERRRVPPTDAAQQRRRVRSVSSPSRSAASTARPGAARRGGRRPNTVVGRGTPTRRPPRRASSAPTLRGHRRSRRTNSDAGSASSSAGVPSWAMRPPVCITAMRVPSSDRLVDVVGDEHDRLGELALQAEELAAAAGPARSGRRRRTARPSAAPAGRRRAPGRRRRAAAGRPRAGPGSASAIAGSSPTSVEQLARPGVAPRACPSRAGGARW